MSESGKIGFVGGMDIPVINRFHAGFVEGAKAVNPDIEIEANYTGAFDDAAKGKIASKRNVLFWRRYYFPRCWWYR